MKKRFQLLVVFILAGLVLVFLVRREPEYRGKAVRKWIGELNSKSEATSQSARRAVKDIGTNASAILLEKLKQSDPPYKSNLDSILRNQTIVKVDLNRASEAHKQAYEGFSALGQAAKSSLPELVKLLDDPPVAQRALYVLCQMDNAVIPFLLAAATNADPGIRAGALADVGNRAVHDREIVAAFVGGLQDPDSKVRWTAANALARYPEDVEVIVPALTQALEDSDRMVRSFAAQSLGAFGERARPAITDLLQIIRTEGRTSTAAGALNKIDPTAAERAGVKVDLTPNPYE